MDDPLLYPTAQKEWSTGETGGLAAKMLLLLGPGLAP
jgi:hypothetical protein